MNEMVILTHHQMPPKLRTENNNEIKKLVGECIYIRQLSDNQNSYFWIKSIILEAYILEGFKS